MKIQTKNKIFTTLVVLISLFFTIASIYALTNYFSKQRKEKIQLMNNLPFFTIERTGGNNEDKTLLPIPIPNLNEQKYNHLITIEHEATLNSDGMDINVPLYLKISTKYDTQQTFINPEKYLNVGLKVDNNDYDDTKRPQIRLNDKGIGSLNIQISIEQKEIITNKNPQLELICDYELVDSKGTAYSGGSQTIENKITNLA
ncbi:MAG: putative secreted protein, SAP09-like [Rapeseed phyllody phytoplasma]|uniref:Putative secreted protein, SAP09-like n=1 Tax=Rapeseed phyllody phytoplasma TaxID=2490543 RepID=A0A859I9U4_9MOLU|nr:MAG: putative secreted protein, SAP09-like [Rapeseed phyllody phytoplasma]